MRKPRLSSLLPSLREPNWETWREVQNAEVWQAVALACDIEPLCVAQWIHPRFPSTDRLVQFQQRIIQAIAALEIHGGNIPVLSDRSPPEYSRVQLGNFRIWTKSVGWSLPKNFPELLPTKVKHESAEERAARLRSLIQTEISKGSTLRTALAAVASGEPSHRAEFKGQTISVETLRKIYYRTKNQ